MLGMFCTSFVILKISEMDDVSMSYLSFFIFYLILKDDHNAMFDYS